MKRGFLTPDAPVSTGAFYIHIKLPPEAVFRQLLVGALMELTQESNWQQSGSMSAAEAAEVWSTIVAEITDVPVVPVGSIIMGYWASPQSNWIACDGGFYQQADWPELMAVYPEEMKNIQAVGDFQTPNLIGRMPVGRGIPDFTHIFAYGQTGGEYEHVLSLDEIPAHTHSESIAVPAVVNGGLEAPAASATATAGVTGSAGGGLAHNNMPPFCVVQFYLVGRMLP